MIDEKKIELLKKIKVLAERGDRGEREAARYQLNRLMEKYNVQDADLSDDTPEMHWYKFSNDYEKRLLIQVFYKVAPNVTIYRHTSGRGTRTERGIYCTKAEALQIEIEYEFYKQLLAKELSFFLSAFIQKHNIFDTSPGHKTMEVDNETLIRMEMLMGGMEDATLHKMISD